MCPCVIYAVGEIQGINSNLGQHHHRIRHHLRRGPGQCDSPDWLTVRQSGLSVSLCDWQAPDTPVCLSRSLRSDAVFTSWLHQTGKELGKSSWSGQPSYTQNELAKQTITFLLSTLHAMTFIGYAGCGSVMTKGKGSFCQHAKGFDQLINMQQSAKTSHLSFQYICKATKEFVPL